MFFLRLFVGVLGVFGSFFFMSISFLEVLQRGVEFYRSFGVSKRCEVLEGVWALEGF